MSKLKLIFRVYEKIILAYLPLLVLLSPLMGCSALSNFIFKEEEANNELNVEKNKPDSIVFTAKNNGSSYDEGNTDEMSMNENTSEANRNASRQKPVGSIYRRRSPEEDLNRIMDGALFDTNSSLGFYFSHNQLKKVTDILIVKVGSEINEFLRTKIKNSLSKKYGDAAWEDPANTGEGSDPSKEVASAEKDPNATAKAKTKSKPNVKPATNGAIADAKNGIDKKTLNMDANNVDIGDITVRISKDLGRGVYEIGGEKNIFIYNKKYVMSLLGTVRSEDIAADGTVASEKISDSKIEFKK